MRRALLASLAAVATLGFSAAAAEAKPVPTDVGIVGVGSLPGGDVAFYGQLASSNSKCLPNRRIEIVATKDGSDTIFDVARSSDNGAWLGRGPMEEIDGAGLTIKLAPKRVKRGGTTINCARMKVQLS